MMEIDFSSVDAYIGSFPESTRILLTELREVIRSAAPGAVEKMAYRMPTFHLNGNLVHFAAYKKHIGFYPTPSGISTFETELRRYRSAKGSVQFPLDEPLPSDLIRKMVAFRVAENSGRKKA